MIMAIVEQMCRPELLSTLGLSSGSGVLLHGPSVGGKTLLAGQTTLENIHVHAVYHKRWYLQ